MPVPRTLRMYLSPSSLVNHSSNHSLSFLSSLPLSLLVFTQLQPHLNTKLWSFICGPQKTIPGKLFVSQVTGPPLTEFTYLHHNEHPQCQQWQPPRKSQTERSALSIKLPPSTGWALWVPHKHISVFTGHVKRVADLRLPSSSGALEVYDLNPGTLRNYSWFLLCWHSLLMPVLSLKRPRENIWRAGARTPGVQAWLHH